MAHCFVKITNATLSYPSSPYNALTLKEEVFKRLRLRKPTRLVYDVQALKHVNLTIHEGERVGIIGRNGAGKSTLLRAIAGVYPLQTGSIETKGKIRGMFDLSLGFEFEATGRENITYRGLLLGESPKSICEKEQKIIDFAELGDFIDFPIKTYSTGMLVRLAFSISTSVNGDILLLDEVMGAGDAGFQLKARKRMEDMINQAKIIVMVSHDMGSVCRVCNRAVYLKNGVVVADGSAESVTKYYLESIQVEGGSI
jgi:lipopolysaccharide transport system ATP-binding protein